MELRHLEFERHQYPFSRGLTPVDSPIIAERQNVFRRHSLIHRRYALTIPSEMFGNFPQSMRDLRYVTRKEATYTTAIQYVLAAMGNPFMGTNRLGRHSYYFKSEGRKMPKYIPAIEILIRNPNAVNKFDYENVSGIRLWWFVSDPQFTAKESMEALLKKTKSRFPDVAEKSGVFYAETSPTLDTDYYRPEDEDLETEERRLLAKKREQDRRNMKEIEKRRKSGIYSFVKERQKCTEFMEFYTTVSNHKELMRDVVKVIHKNGDLENFLLFENSNDRIFRNSVWNDQLNPECYGDRGKYCFPDNELVWEWNIENFMWYEIQKYYFPWIQSYFDIYYAELKNSIAATSNSEEHNHLRGIEPKEDKTVTQQDILELSMTVSAPKDACRRVQMEMKEKKDRMINIWPDLTNAQREKLYKAFTSDAFQRVVSIMRPEADISNPLKSILMWKIGNDFSEKELFWPTRAPRYSRFCNLLMRISWGLEIFDLVLSHHALFPVFLMTHYGSLKDMMIATEETGGPEKIHVIFDGGAGAGKSMLSGLLMKRTINGTIVYSDVSSEKAVTGTNPNNYATTIVDEGLAFMNTDTTRLSKGQAEQLSLLKTMLIKQVIASCHLDLRLNPDTGIRDRVKSSTVVEMNGAYICNMNTSLHSGSDHALKDRFLSVKAFVGSREEKSQTSLIGLRPPDHLYKGSQDFTFMLQFLQFMYNEHARHESGYSMPSPDISVLQWFWQVADKTLSRTNLHTSRARDVKRMYILANSFTVCNGIDTRFCSEISDKHVRDYLPTDIKKILPCLVTSEDIAIFALSSHLMNTLDYVPHYLLRAISRIRAHWGREEKDIVYHKFEAPYMNTEGQQQAPREFIDPNYVYIKGSPMEIAESNHESIADSRIRKIGKDTIAEIIYEFHKRRITVRNPKKYLTKSTDGFIECTRENGFAFEDPEPEQRVIEFMRDGNGDRPKITGILISVEFLLSDPSNIIRRILDELEYNGTRVDPRTADVLMESDIFPVVKDAYVKDEKIIYEKGHVFYDKNIPQGVPVNYRRGTFDVTNCDVWQNPVDQKTIAFRHPLSKREKRHMNDLNKSGWEHVIKSGKKLFRKEEYEEFVNHYTELVGEAPSTGYRLVLVNETVEGMPDVYRTEKMHRNRGKCLKWSNPFYFRKEARDFFGQYNMESSLTSQKEVYLYESIEEYATREFAKRHFIENQHWEEWLPKNVQWRIYERVLDLPGHLQYPGC